MKSILLVTCALTGFAAAETAIPTAYGKDRYRETFAQSPFVFAAVELPPAPPPEDHLKDLVVMGMGKLDDGRDFVIVQRTGDTHALRFEGMGRTQDGYGIKAVKWGDQWKESSILMTYGAEEKELKFNPHPQAAPRAQPPIPPKPDNRKNPGPRVSLRPQRR
jgi:hypothetical protein